MKKFFGIIFICLGVFLVLYVLYANSPYSSLTREFSPYTLLSSSWEKYKTSFINNDGRVIDYTQNAITTSEGQSYALLRAVWVDDRPTFDRVWNWTKNNLDRPNDHLFGWRWGELQNGSYGFISGGGSNNASDADQDIALALLLASSRWNEKSYRDQALPIINDIWRIDTVSVNGKRYMSAGIWANESNSVVINPSYFAPYAWRIFAKVDTSHNWNSLITPAYELLARAGKDPLDTSKGVGLPPDWVVMDKNTGALSASDNPSLKTTYSYDAVRVPWRIALDYKWNNSKEAKEYLLQSFRILSATYQKGHKLSDSYFHDGKPASSNENPTMYATIIGYMQIYNSKLADMLYQQKILSVYTNKDNSFRSDLPYYEQNWLWFGAALYNNFLSDFKLSS